MRLLDLFCCEGAGAVGYHRAGFDVVGVDITRQRRYPFEFRQADALDVLADVDYVRTFDVVHASPPCQAYSITRHSHSVEHPALVEPTRAALIEAGVPWVMENVPGAPLLNATVLCGAAFGLTTVDDDGTPLVLRRHRLFESSHLLLAAACACAEYRALGYTVGGVYGGGSPDRSHAKQVRRGGYTPSKARMAELIGCDHLTGHGLSQSIPPAYTEALGGQMMTHLSAATPAVTV